MGGGAARHAPCAPPTPPDQAGPIARGDTAPPDAPPNQRAAWVTVPLKSARHRRAGASDWPRELPVTAPSHGRGAAATGGPRERLRRAGSPPGGEASGLKGPVPRAARALRRERRGSAAADRRVLTWASGEAGTLRGDGSPGAERATDGVSP